MKQLLLPALLLAGVTSTPAQLLKPAQVPAAARATFKARFPMVKTNTWEREGDRFEAGFRLKGRSMSAIITPVGELVETETDMPPAQLPAAVRATLARDFGNYRITEAATLISGRGITTYEAEVSKGGQRQDVVFNANGTRVRR